ncbi:hypothetical protein [Terrabacter sp. 2TAF16]|uniref:hypothetical protein n=1 Tax=Terrabacter sp. 2TAF16 TaxID=3233008 RepID=UPI003F94AECD
MIGMPIGSGSATPTQQQVEALTDYAFKSRVGLLFLDECLGKGVHLGAEAQELHNTLVHRRFETDRVVKKLAQRLDEVAQGEWVLFKSIKPFASTPNDTDWFPLDPGRHKELCDHLLATGDFKLLETAPRQTTLIETSGEGMTDTTKRGGIYYIDCYVVPSTDYFVYFDTTRMRRYVRSTDVAGYPVPVLAPEAELASILFHNVFPERSFSHESYYLVKSYLDQMERAESLEHFVEVCVDQKMEYAICANLSLVREIDTVIFDIRDERVDRVMTALGHAGLVVKGFDPNGVLPFEFPNRVYWRAFASKNRDRTSARSSLTQLRHMANPVFFADVVKIIWRRSVRGGVYEQN